MDYSFSYKIDQDAGTLKIWINATFQGDSRFDGFEFVVFTKDTLQKDKYRYNFIFNDHIVRWDNAPHHSEIKTFQNIFEKFSFLDGTQGGSCVIPTLYE